MILPFGMVWLWCVGRLISDAAFAKRRAVLHAAKSVMNQMPLTEIQTATMIAAVGKASANMGKSTINLFFTAGMIAIRRDSVPDITLPLFVETDRPAHPRRLRCRARIPVFGERCRFFLRRHSPS